MRRLTIKNGCYGEHITIQDFDIESDVGNEEIQRGWKFTKSVESLSDDEIEELIAEVVVSLVKCGRSYPLEILKQLIETFGVTEYAEDSCEQCGHTYSETIYEFE